MERLNRLLTISSQNPDDQRRSWLLNILLLSVAALAILAILAMAVATLMGAAGGGRLLIGSLIMLASVGVLLVINHYGAGWIASSIFLLLLTVLFGFTDEPQQVADGRSLFMFAIPIIMASVILRPYASFIVAGLSSLVITVAALSIQYVPNVPAMLGFLALAVVSWLSARSLEHALAEVRAINRELDQRVEQRTRDLAAALSREQAEASKNQAILEGIADGVIVFNEERKAIVTNPAMAQLIERPMWRITGTDIETLMAQDVSPDDQEMILDLLGDGASQDAPSVKFDWGEKTLSVSMAPVRAAPDVVTGTVAVFRDFTREAEVERMKSAFVSMVSHDLRTPLGAIMGYTDMLEQSVYGPLTEKQMGVMARINANTSRLLNMVNNLLDQAQIEAGKLTFHISRFAPRELLSEVDAVMGILAQAKELQLVCKVDASVPEKLSGDPQRLHQIVVNLVSNALKFTEQGQVGVRIYTHDPERWAIDVSDTGPGIPPEAQTYIFEAFRQVEGDQANNHTGFGLGLSIVKQLATLMGGEVKLESELGRGSTFTVIMPFSPTQEEKP